MFDRKNDYALNIADKNAIVYQDAFGNLTRITPDQLTGIKEFRKWKNWSKMKAHTTEKKEHIHRNHTVSLSDQEGQIIGDEGCDASYEEKETSMEKEIFAKEMVCKIQLILTDKQFSRLWMYAVDGKSLAVIAELENVSIASIHESIESARKKCRKFFKTP